jgi:hypothetical protein
VTTVSIARVRRRLERLGPAGATISDDGADPLADESAALAGLSRATILGRTALGSRAGRGPVRWGADPDAPWLEPTCRSTPTTAASTSTPPCTSRRAIASGSRFQNISKLANRPPEAGMFRRKTRPSRPRRRQSGRLGEWGSAARKDAAIPIANSPTTR